MVRYGRGRAMRMGMVGWLVTALGVLVAPLVTIFLVNTMFGTSIPLSLVNYMLVFAIFVVVLFVVGAFGLLGKKVG